ncbi:hypothetical protein ACLOJK_002013 [Asimina triloba]
MKNLYPRRRRSKGKIHPATAASASASSFSSSPCLLLNRLPPEIRSLVSTQLPPEDLEILSYLIKTNHQPTTSSSASCTARSLSPFDCNCFHCCTIFWTRWDSSPSRNLIHQALDAFEQQQQTPRKRNRRVSADKSKKTAQKSVSIQQPCRSDDGLEEVEKKSDISDVSEVGGVIFQQARAHQLQEEGEEEDALERKVWPDVLGFLNSRLWCRWSPNI